MSRKVKDLEWRCQLIEQRLESVEVKLDALAHVVQNDLTNLDDMIEAHIDGKVRMMVVKNLESYRKGKAIKKEIDYISEVLGDKDEQTK